MSGYICDFCKKRVMSAVTDAVLGKTFCMDCLEKHYDIKEIAKLNERFKLRKGVNTK